MNIYGYLIFSAIPEMADLLNKYLVAFDCIVSIIVSPNGIWVWKFLIKLQIQADIILEQEAVVCNWKFGKCIFGRSLLSWVRF